ncbi:MAG: DUF4013 domain-containing protein [Methanobrevibacter sp.]|nr:DUF4013 domain-containing protein [Methanobrevibacter sp.]
MILDIFKDCFEYSFKEPKTILKLGVLSILSSLIIPYFLISGYYYRITKIGVNGMINGDDPLPKFEHWGTMFLEGIKLFVVRLIYSIPTIIVFSLGTIIFLLYSIQTIAIDKAPSFPTLFIIIGVISISTIVWLIFYLLSNVAIPNMINNNGSIKSAFKIREIIAIVKSIGIYKYIQFYTGLIVLLLGIVSTTFLFFALIGFAFGLILSPSMGPIAMAFSGIFMSITSSIALYLVLNPFFMIFEGRAIALMYNTREDE